MQLTRAEIDGFLGERHTLVIGTLRRDGRPQLSTVWYRWDGVAFWIATNRTRAKFRNIERDPRVTVLVDAPARESSVTGYGLAEMVAEDEAAFDGALAIVARYVDDARAYLEQRRDDARVLVRIEPREVLSWRLEG